MITKIKSDKTKNKKTENSTEKQTQEKQAQHHSHAEQFDNILICLDSSHVSASVIPYAQILANALHTGIQLVHVIEPDHAHEAPFDPVEWSLRRQKASTYLNNMKSQYHLDTENTSTVVLEGEPAAAIDSGLKNSHNEISVFCRKEGREQGHIGGTSRKLLERSVGSIFLVPERAKTPEPANFQRIMVPLDGSSRAETVLPIASSIAQHYGASIVLVYAVPQPDVLDDTPGDSKSEMLRYALNKHNRTCAQRYLDRIGRRLNQTKVKIEKRVLSGNDAKHLLIRSISLQNVDCVVLSSHGVSAQADVPFGDVTNHVLSHSPVPVLMLRDLTLSSAASLMIKLSNSSGRLPDAASNE